MCHVELQSFPWYRLIDITGHKFDYQLEALMGRVGGVGRSGWKILVQCCAGVRVDGVKTKLLFFLYCTAQTWT